MIESFKNFLAPPLFDDRGKTQKARLINYFLILLIGLIVIYELIYLIWNIITGDKLFANQSGTNAIIVIGTALLIGIGLKILLKRGFVQTASIVLLIIIFIIGVAGSLSYGGIRGTSLTLMFLPISLASFLLNRKASVFIISWGLLASLILFYTQSQGILLFNVSTEFSFTEWLIFATIMGLIGWIQNMYVGSVHNNLIQIKDQEDALADSQIELENVRSTLKEYTATVERRTRYLEAAAEVGQAATSIYNLEELLPQVVNFISERFGFYQTGIFLLDDAGEYAILRAASSEGGRRMLARNHRLKVRAEGIVGYVTGSGKVRIALDVGEDAVHFNTPELPQTRSEMALPLFYSGRLFGALDVQSTESNAFSDEDISALRVLADQVSMAINNAQLFEQLQNSLESERLAYGEISSEAWRKLTKSKENWGYKYSNNNLVPVDGNWSEDMAEAAYMEKNITSNKENKPTLAIPIRIGNHVAGVIRLRKDINHTDWTSDELELIETLIDRLGQALESARIFQSSQKLAAKEQLTSEISSHIRQTLNIDTVLQTAVKELGEAFKAKEVVIRMNPKSS